MTAIRRTGAAPGEHGAAGYLLSLFTASEPPPFALLYRPSSAGDTVEILVGTATSVASTADIPVSSQPVLAVLPYRQLAERGLPVPDDSAPLVVLTAERRVRISTAELLRTIPDSALRLEQGRFDISDERYAELVEAALGEIGRGEGANFVLSRRYLARLAEYSVAAAVVLFSRLLRCESGVHWTFLVHTGDRTFVGASPERHVGVRAGRVLMNPISGTYRYPADGPTVAGVLEFLGNRKETYELYMVLDEELKMMSQVCHRVRVTGPALKQMSGLAHTEYIIEGQSVHDPRAILRSTMFAPTVTGSPVENAARILSRYEPAGRGYYSGVVALFDRDETGAERLDSAILIRTADIDAAGQLSIGVGATLVRDSEPAAEVAETRAKIAGLLAALTAPPVLELDREPAVRSALQARNTDIARYWLDERDAGPPEFPRLVGRRIVVVDAEDAFSAMLAHQVRSLGAQVSVRSAVDGAPHLDADIVVMGPGPGAPSASADPRIAGLHRCIDRLLAAERPFLAVCLSHQILGRMLGVELLRRSVPNQGVQREIDLFGQREQVGFYNSFTLRSNADYLHPVGRAPVQVCRDASGEVFALRGVHFASIQFHPESILTRNGEQILGRLLTEILVSGRSQPVPADRGARPSDVSGPI